MKQHTRSETGFATIDVLIGLAIASVIIASASAFTMTAVKTAQEQVRDMDTATRLIVAWRTFVRNMDDAHTAHANSVVVSPSEVLIDAGEVTHRWAVEDGTLVSQTAPDTTPVDWSGVPKRVWAKGVAPDAFEAPVEYGGRLVEVTWLTAEGPKVDTAVAVRP